MWCAWTLGRRSALRRNTAGSHHRVIDAAEAEGSDNNRAYRKRSQKGKGTGNEKGRRVKFEEACPSQVVHSGDPDERKSHINVCASWEVLDCGVAKSRA